MTQYNLKTRTGQRVIQMGASRDALTDQLQDTGLRPEQIKNYHEDAEAITRLVLKGLIDDKQAKQARYKLGVTIQRTLNPLLRKQKVGA